MTFTTTLKEILDSGDPLVREWPLVRSYTLPIILCGLYVFFVKRLGPVLMRNRKPFHLRGLMIAYNFAVVFVYVACFSSIIYTVLSTDGYKKVCKKTVITEEDYTYRVAIVAWVLYAVKYLEFADTVFFILRKKDYLITNLHVIHHAVLPLMFWVGMRSETSGFQFIPVGINAFVHIIMYTYYGLAAMGPEMQKRLWWKEYLTRLQMTQFIVIILTVFVFVPLFGCATTSHGMFLDLFGAIFFFFMFYNFYNHTYCKTPAESTANKRKSPKKKVETNGSSPNLEFLAESIDNCTGSLKHS